MRTRPRILVLSLACLAGLAACKDSTGSTGDESGSLSFTYAGSAAGSFSANGVFPRSSGVPTVQFAAAIRDTANGEPYMALVGFQPTTNGRGHLVEFDFANSTAPQTLTLDESCYAQDTLTGCAVALVGLNYDLSTGSSVAGEESYFFDSGTFTVSSVSADHVRGTFTGHATDVDTGHTIDVTGGQFDVPFVRPGSGVLSRALTSRPSLLRAHR
jgi:hypothetical protein